jgi:hypothetical protein
VIAAIAARLVGWGLPKEFGKPFAWIGIVLLALLILWGAKTAYDRSVVKEDDLEEEVEELRADAVADEAARKRELEAAERRAQEAQELKEAITHVPNDPNVDDAVERKLAFHRCLKLQQDARQNGSQPPACV